MPSLPLSLIPIATWLLISRLREWGWGGIRRRNPSTTQAGTSRHRIVRPPAISCHAENGTAYRDDSGSLITSTTSRLLGGPLPRTSIPPIVQLGPTATVAAEKISQDRLMETVGSSNNERRVIRPSHQFPQPLLLDFRLRQGQIQNPAGKTPLHNPLICVQPESFSLPEVSIKENMSFVPIFFVEGGLFSEAMLCRNGPGF